MTVQFVTKPDECGLGRIVYDGRFYGLPVELVRDFESLYKYREGLMSAQDEITSETRGKTEL